MEKSKVSVIVPVYNVEKYVDNCLISILNQSYKNLEIILVDDGSTDSSLKICNKYEKKDDRIKVFHKENGGLSSARNYGLKKACGDYIFFIDSDDYICSNTIELLYYSLIKNNADIACGKELFVHNFDTNLVANTNFESKTYTNEQALEKMLYMTEISNSACNKLYRKELLKNIEFPIGKLYEDLGTIYKVIAKANKVIFNDVFSYNYFIRSGSITHSKFKRDEMISLTFSKEILEYVERYFPSIISSANFKIDMEAIMLLMKIPNNRNYSVENNTIKKIIKKYNMNVIKDRKVRYNWKISCISIMLGRHIARLIWNFKLYIKKRLMSIKGNIKNG